MDIVINFDVAAISSMETATLILAAIDDALQAIQRSCKASTISIRWSVTQARCKYKEGFMRMCMLSNPIYLVTGTDCNYDNLASQQANATRTFPSFAMTSEGLEWR